MGEGIATAVTEMFDIMTSGMGAFGSGFGKGLAETAKYGFFEVSAEGVITGLGAYGGVVAFGLAISLAMSAAYLVFNII
jgi:hypothetical protein